MKTMGRAVMIGVTGLLCACGSAAPESNGGTGALSEAGRCTTGGGAPNGSSGEGDSGNRLDAGDAGDADRAESSSGDGDAGGEAGPPARDLRVWPFSSQSPWNMPIGTGAQYAPFLTSTLPAGINYDGHWTCSVVLATQGDPLVTMYLDKDAATNWDFLNGGGAVCGNSAADEQMLLSLSSTTLPSSKNVYSTTPISAYHDAHDDYSATFHIPAGACASPDTDAQMAVFQPDGWVLEIYDAIHLSTGDVVGEIASYTDAHGDGTGYWNGRRASMLPNFAGLIRTGELAAEHIPHALVGIFGAELLAPVAVWPANAFDTNSSGYTGMLPMGALVAIPAAVDVASLGLSAKGAAVAHAAQDYGIYVGDTGGTGITLQAELGDPELDDGLANDLPTIANLLQRIVNNTAATPGGGGTPRAPLAPPLP